MLWQHSLIQAYVYLFSFLLNMEKSGKFKNKNEIYDCSHFIQYLHFNILKIDESFFCAY